jgi:sugar/nucleoside kinase (ribokinase family)
VTGKVLCAGIIVADHVCNPISHVPAAGELVTTDRMLLTIGGCAANAAVDLVKMGVAAAVAGRVGDDVFGRIVSELLRGHGVDVSGLRTSAGAETSQTLIVNVKGEDRRFIHTFGANAEFRAADLPLDRLGEYKVLYVGGYLVMPSLRQEDLIPVFQKARAAGVKTVLDVVVPGRGDHLAQLSGLLPHVDVFLPNNHEAELICGEKDPVRQAEFFRKQGAGTVVITMGGEGSVLVQKDLRLRAGAYSVPYVDG